jgi:hypothetical protein
MNRLPAFALLLCTAPVLADGPAPPPSRRPLAAGPAKFVDPRRGDDGHDGSRAHPWKTVARALRGLRPGDTLYLRGGVYREPVRIALAGRKDAPITLRSFPGEQAILDTGIAEFFIDPAKSWEPAPGGAPGEYRSRRRFPNLRDVMGSFGDSMVGLHTYHHAKDLRAAGEIWKIPEGKDPREADVEPVYCGPGLWYDRDTGHIHVRLAHTHLPGLPNYEGETDPRKLPLVIAPFRALPLHLDGARHVVLQDLVIRGGGHDTVVLDQAGDVELDNLTIFAGTYGIRARGTQRLRLVNCGVFGSVPPWCFRSDTSLRSYPGRPHRDITRFGTHALLVADAGREFSVFFYPFNDDWEIAHCEFAGAHDGVYLGGITLRFHHNRIHSLQDDGIYLSPMYPRHLPEPAVLDVYQNHFTGCLTALAFGGPEQTTDLVRIYRNIIDLRRPVPTGRPREKGAAPGLNTGKVMGDHGSPPWPRMHLYHNTFVMAGPSRSADMAVLNAAKEERPRRVFNNAFVHLARLPALRVPGAALAHQDGNLYWHPGLDAKRAKAFFRRYRNSPAFAADRKAYPPGLTAHPKFPGEGDYRTRPGSPLVDAGVALPADWPDPLREKDRGKPDIGALPLGVAAWPTGREGGKGEK